jgi:hypothetical protein
VTEYKLALCLELAKLWITMGLSASEDLKQWIRYIYEWDDEYGDQSFSDLESDYDDASFSGDEKP